MTRATHYIFIILSATVFLCCQNNKKQAVLPPDTTKHGNVYTTHSRDTAKLAKLIDLRIYKPAAVEFQYTYIDNSGANDRLSVPGPSDGYLQAILYFDSATYGRLLKVCNDPPPGSVAINRSSKNDFAFDWLSNDAKEELLKSDSSHHNYTCAPFNTATLWLLNKKVLLTKESF
jgi:hypothetical protein